MPVLGAGQSRSSRRGVGVVQGSTGSQLELVGVGVVRTPADQDHAHRLLAIETGIEEWVRSYAPEAIAVERVFAQHNLQSVTGTSQAAGIAMLVAARHAIPVVLHTPSEVKAAITGSGRADKAQVGTMVARILKLAVAPRPADAADAVALAICHIWRGGATNRYAEAVARANATRPASRIPSRGRA